MKTMAGSLAAGAALAAAPGTARADERLAYAAVLEAVPAVLLAGGAAAAVQRGSQAGPKAVVSDVATGSDGMVTVEISYLNDGDAEQIVSLPATRAATLGGGAVTLARVDAAGTLRVAPGGFARARYRVAAPAGGTGTAVLALNGMTPTVIALAEAAPSTPAATASPQLAATGAPVSAATSPSQAVVVDPAFPQAETFLAALSTDAPVYAAFGSGTNTNGRLQISFKYHLFGEGGAIDLGDRTLGGIYFGYTQRMFWDLAAESSPFRSVDYMPRIFYRVEGEPGADGSNFAVEGGFRHESNGRSGFASRNVNSLYVQPSASFSLAGYDLIVGPRASWYFGGKLDNPDIERFRGLGGLAFDIGEPDGLKLTSFTRYNFHSGKGAVEGELSYPLTRLIAPDVNLYLVLQGFHGYGENLFDYNQRDTRLRIGFGIVR